MTAHRHHDATGKRWLTANDGPHVHPPDAKLTARVKTLEEQMARIILAQPILVPRPVVSSEVIFTVTPATAKASIEAAIASTSYDAVEWTTGTYTHERLAVSGDHSSRPLTIRPASGALCTFRGPGVTSDGTFVFGETALTSYVTFDGANGSGGKGFYFFDIELAASGLFQVYSSSHCNIGGIKAEALRRSTTIGDDPQPYKTWIFYISMGSGVRNNADLAIHDIQVLTPAIVRNHAFANNGSSTLVNGNISFTDIELHDLSYAFYGDVANTGSQLTLNRWQMTNCGWSGDPSSIRTTAKDINGTYSNIVATGSDPLNNGSTGSFTSGGGNSGI